MLTASDHNTQEGRGQQFSPEQICSAIRDLRQVVNPDVRVEMLLRVVVNHGLEEPAVVAEALAELEHINCSAPVRHKALARLRPQPAMHWQVVGPKCVVEVRLDPELGRLAIGLNKAAHLRLWALGRHLSTEAHGGCGWLEIEALWEQLKPVGIEYTRRHFRRLLSSGVGTFWTCTHNRVYFIGVQKLAAQLAAAATNQVDLIRTNRPGNMKDVYLWVDGGLECWESLIYAGWLAAKENPIIARETLAALFGRSAKTIRQWEKDRLQQIVSIRPCYAQMSDPQTNAAQIPEHSYAYVAGLREPGHWQVRHEIRIRWRLPNCYHSRIRQHNHRGQSRKVLNQTNVVLDLQPPDETAGGMRRNPRRYFEDGKHLQRMLRRYGRAGQLWQTGSYGSEKYLYLGRDHCDYNLFEPSSDGYARTQVDERVGENLEGWLLL